MYIYICFYLYLYAYLRRKIAKLICTGHVKIHLCDLLSSDLMRGDILSYGMT